MWNSRKLQEASFYSSLHCQTSYCVSSKYRQKEQLLCICQSIISNQMFTITLQIFVSTFKIHQIQVPYSYLPLVYISLMYTILIIITFILYHFTLQHRKHFTNLLTTNQSLSGCYPVKENLEVLCWSLIWKFDQILAQ